MTLILALILVSMFTACGGDNNARVTASAGEAESSAMKNDYFYGKITSIVGNEIELALAEMPESGAAMIGGVKDEEAIFEGNGSGSVSSSAADAGITGSMGDVGENMEFTGENVTLTLPAGVKLYSMGKEIALSALEKGSIISVSVDNLEDKNVLSVDVMG